MKEQEVKININGKKRVVEEKKNMKKNDAPTLQDETDEGRPIIIVDETAAAIEKEEEFDWVLPDKEVIEKKEEKEQNSTSTSYIEDLRALNQGKPKGGKPSKSSWKKKSSFSPSKQWIISIMLAIGVGLGFGGVILYAMNIASTPTEPSAPVFNPIPDGEKTNDNEGGDPPAGTGQYTFPALPVAVLQGGVFSSKDGANEVARTYEQKGMAGVTIEDDNVRVYVAIGDSVGVMKAIGDSMEQIGTEKEYAKDFLIPEKSWTGLTEQDVTMMEEAQPLFAELVTLSSKLLSGSSVDEQALAASRARAEKIASVSNESLSESMVKIKEDIVGAFTNVQTFASSQSKEELWKAQQKLLNITSILTN
ncbi:hypothetical protein [Sutcliffiella sp. NC1]|uniref:hypothetical protein n=1 Tax=Sutcliffiella sp. NC1 TaxID=3004096 RepID=UPI0022DD81FD|nr:hypothetical protein [Sutcliffiella sp. NC1]WBL13990.1 hypothetical protein O1A01_19060 [Sutcliffiella sp. NC1]